MSQIKVESLHSPSKNISKKVDELVTTGNSDTFTVQGTSRTLIGHLEQALGSGGAITGITSVGLAGESLVAGQTGSNMEIRKIKNGANISLNVVDGSLEISSSGGGGGAINTIQNTTGTGLVGIYSTMVGTAAELKSLRAGANVTIDGSDPNFIEISASGGGGGGGITYQPWLDKVASDKRIELDTGSVGAYFWKTERGGKTTQIVNPSGAPADAFQDLLNTTVAGVDLDSPNDLVDIRRVSGQQTGGPTSGGLWFDHRMSGRVTTISNFGGHQTGTSGTSNTYGVISGVMNKIEHRGAGYVAGTANHIQTFGNGSISSTWANGQTAIGTLNWLESEAASTNMIALSTVMQDNSFYGVTAIGTRITQDRGSSSNGSLGNIYVGHQLFSYGSRDADVGFQVNGRYDVGLDLTGITGWSGTEDGKAAILIPARAKIYTAGIQRTNGYTNPIPSVSGMQNASSPYIMCDGTYTYIKNSTTSMDEFFNITAPDVYTSATGGGASALPATPYRYLKVSLNGNPNFRIPLYKA